jgi:hypothetical protein
MYDIRCKMQDIGCTKLSMDKSKNYVFTKCLVTKMPLVSDMVMKYVPWGKRAVLI